MDPWTLTQEMERNRSIPDGPEERFRGYGIMGLPFTSGHVLAFRRMTASSIGPPYITIWHRDPAGGWTFFTDLEPNRSCPRYFGRAAREVVTGEIEMSWEGPYEVSLRVPEVRMQWGVRLSRDVWTRVMSLVGPVIPDAVWNHQRALQALGTMGGRILDVGVLALSGQAPNGQRFQVAPKRLWRVEATAAILGSEDLGSMGPLPEQAKLGDFRIPNGGIFAMGEARFLPRQDGDVPLDPGWVRDRATAREESGLEENMSQENMSQERRQVS